MKQLKLVCYDQKKDKILIIRPTQIASIDIRPINTPPAAIILLGEL